MSRESTLKILLVAYVISVGFTDILELPIVGSKIQLSEFIFIPLIIVWALHVYHRFSFNHINATRLEYSILFYFLVVFVSSLVAGQAKSWFELLGCIYLAMIYLVFKTTLSLISNHLGFIVTAFVACGVVAAISGITGWVLAQFGIDTWLAMPADIYYPYLGYIGRATGFMVSPNMLFNLLGVSLLLYLPSFLELKVKKFIHCLIILIISIATLLTFSKSILLLLIAVFFIFAQKSNTWKSYKSAWIMSCAILFSICMTGTHILIRKNDGIDWSVRKEKAYTQEKPFAETGNLLLFITNYTVNKESALQAGLRNPLTGVGPGGFNEFVGQLKEEGRYPENFINFDPHSTYLGAFAELGFLGLASLLFLCNQIFRTLQEADNNVSNKALILSLSSCFLFMSMEAINMDIMNFRHLWILLGVLAMMQISSKK